MMSYRKKVSRLPGIILFICYYFSLPAHAQRIFEVYSNYSAVPVGDTILLTYQYTGEEELTSFDAHLKDFLITEGPAQSLSSQSSETGGKFTTTHTTAISYHIKMNNPGSFTIPAAEARDHTGKSHFTNPIVVEVKEGQFKKVRNNTPDPHADFDEFMAGLQEDEVHQAMHNIPYPYVLITGFVYRRKTENDSSKLIMLSIDNLMDKRAETLLLGTVVQDGKPRKYYSIGDTTGLRMQLQDVYDQKRSHAKYAIMIIRKEDWEENNEYRFFENAGSIWTEIDELTGYIAPSKKALLNRWEVQFTCFMTDPGDLKSLSVFATRNGYSLDSKYDQQKGNYTVTLKKQSDIIPEHLLTMGLELMKETEKFKQDPNRKVYTGYAGMAIQQVPEKKQ